MISFHFIPFHSISFHFIPFHSIPFHFISFHFISFHFMSFSLFAFEGLELDLICQNAALSPVPWGAAAAMLCQLQARTCKEPKGPRHLGGASHETQQQHGGHCAEPTCGTLTLGDSTCYAMPCHAMLCYAMLCYAMHVF